MRRADGFAWCMSGPNSTLAGAAYARSRLRKTESGDLVLVHCNSYADGYWTAITRTWCAVEPDARAKDIFAAVFAAREVAFAAIQPGVCAASVNQAARQKMQQYGFAAAFKHSPDMASDLRRLTRRRAPICTRRQPMFWSLEWLSTWNPRPILRAMAARGTATW